MLFTKNFICYLLLMFVDLLIIVNVIYAFNLQNVLPSVYAGGYMVDDLSNSYFGINSLINGFKSYFGLNPFLSEYRSFLNQFFVFFNRLSYQNLFVESTSSLHLGTTGNLVVGILSVVNFFTNISYQFAVIIYGLFLLVYALSIVVNFVLFVVAIASGGFSTELPNTYAEVYNLAIIPCF